MVYFIVIPLCTLLLLVLYLFFAPFYLEIDSNIGLYRIRFYGLAWARLKMEENLSIELNVFGWKKDFQMKLPPTS